ncbi:MAG TPA: DUF1707 domain-containing protein [Streptosporangiaceae bacterium]
MEPRSERQSHLRASHAERERVIETLKAAYVYGLVTKDEFDARVSQVFASRTYGELAPVTADIPPGLAAVPPGPAPAKGSAPVHANIGPRDRAVMATAILAGVAWAASVFTIKAGDPVSAWLALGGTGSVFASLSMLATQRRASRRGQRPGGQLPTQQGIYTGPGTGRRAARWGQDGPGAALSWI